MEKLLPLLKPWFRRDSTCWQEVLHRHYSHFTGRVKLWYLSAGFDLQPFLIFHCPQHAEYPRPSLYVYSDYGFTYKGLLKFRNYLQHHRYLDAPGGFSGLFLYKAIPLSFFSEEKRRSLNSTYGNSSKALPAPFDAVALLFGCGEAPSSIPCLYFVMANRLFLYEIALPYGLTFGMISTVTDGCRNTSNATCPNEAYEEYRQLLEKNGLWFTDHFNKQQPAAFTQIGEIPGWGHYDLNDKTYVYRLW